MRQPTIDGTPQPATRVRRGSRGPHPKPAEQMPVRTVKVPSYLETERSIAVLRAAEPGLSDAALIRKLIDAKAAELLQAGVELNIQEPLLD